MNARPELLLVNEFHPETIATLDAAYRTHKLWLADDPDGLIAALSELSASTGRPRCEAAASASWVCDPRVYRLPGLKLLACFGVGTDGIDLQLAAARGIRVTNTPGVLNDAVADLALALILNTHRNLIQADRFVREGRWLQGAFPFSRSLQGRRLGILGLGAIGEGIVRRALPFGMQIAYHNRQRKNLPYPWYPSISALAAQSDILLSMLPGGAQTRRVINAEVFSALGPEGIFINVGRGSTVDEDALVDALQRGVIAGAGLDVFAREPHVPPALLQRDNVVLCPHVGSATRETRRAMGQLVIDNLASWWATHTPLTPV
jgi:lactate dehydrogenase-like 2-hydroxyacid dehydrogenase